MLFGFFQLLYTRFGMLNDGFHIIIDSVQNRSLIDHQHGEFLKNLSQFLNALRDFLYFLITRLNGLRQVVDHGHLLRREEIAASAGPAVGTAAVEVDPEFRIHARNESTAFLCLNFGQVLALRLSERH